MAVISNFVWGKLVKQVYKHRNDRINHPHTCESPHEYKSLEIGSLGFKVRAVLPKAALPFLKPKTLLKLILLHYRD